MTIFIPSKLGGHSEGNVNTNGNLKMQKLKISFMHTDVIQPVTFHDHAKQFFLARYKFHLMHTELLHYVCFDSCEIYGIGVSQKWQF
jgi:hypothetical protein